MLNTDAGVTVSNPTLKSSRGPATQDWVSQNAPVQVTYDPSTNTCTCSPSSVTITKNNSGNIGVTIGLASGSSGSVAFGNPPINWVSQPPGASVNPSQGGGQRITITDPNSSSGTYSFTVNYVYTPTSGPQVSGTGDPTIVNEGTGGEGDGDDDRHGNQGGDGRHPRRLTS